MRRQVKTLRTMGMEDQAKVWNAVEDIYVALFRMQKMLQGLRMEQVMVEKARTNEEQYAALLGIWRQLGIPGDVPESHLDKNAYPLDMKSDMIAERIEGHLEFVNRSFSNVASGLLSRDLNYIMNLWRDHCMNEDSWYAVRDLTPTLATIETVLMYEDWPAKR